MLYMILKHAHSGFRWLVLLFLLVAIVNGLRNWKGARPVGDAERKMNLFALIFTHIQFLGGLVLYFISSKVVFSGESMKIAMNRFFLVEHPFLMIIAIALITIGYSRAKRADNPGLASRRVFWFYLIGLVLILAGIPWPSKGFGTAWF